MSVKYATVKIPQGLADKIVKVAIQEQATYRTVSEFVIQAARQHLEEINRP